MTPLRSDVTGLLQPHETVAGVSVGTPDVRAEVTQFTNDLSPVGRLRGPAAGQSCHKVIALALGINNLLVRPLCTPEQERQVLGRACLPGSRS